MLGKELGGEPVHGKRLLRHVALGIDVAVEFAPGRDVVHQLDAGDLDDAVPVCRVEPGRLGVDHDLAHRLPSSAPVPRTSAGAAPFACRSTSDDRAQPAQRQRRGPARSARRNRRAAASRGPASALAGSRRSGVSVMPGRRMTRSRCSQRRRRHDEHIVDSAGRRRSRTAAGCRARPAARAARRRAATKRRSAGAHHRMQDRFEPAQRRRIAEDPLAEPAPVDRAGFAAHAGKRGLDGATAAPPGPSRRCTTASASNSGTPSRRSIAAAVLLPMPIEPVRPRTITAPAAARRVARIAARSSRRHPHRRAEPRLEAGPALMQQHAEPVDPAMAALPRRGQQRAFRAAHRRCRRRRRRAADATDRDPAPARRSCRGWSC